MLQGRFQEVIAEAEGVYSLRFILELQLQKILVEYLSWSAADTQQHQLPFVNYEPILFKVTKEKAPLYGIGINEIVEAQPMSMPSSLIFMIGSENSNDS